MARKKADPVEDLDLEEDFEDFDEEEEAEAKPKRRGKKAAAKEETPKGIGAREMAEFLEVEPKTFRAWIRRKLEAGELDLGDREAKQRYNFGEDFDSPEAQAVIQLHAADKEAEAERRAEAARKRAEASDDEAEEAPKKKATPRKKAAAKKS